MNFDRSGGDPRVAIRLATEEDVPQILGFIRSLAEYEQLSHEVRADEGRLRKSLFGDQTNVWALLAEFDGAPAGFAVYFSNFSTFLGRPGLYLEDLFVRPEHRGRGVGKALLSALAGIAIDRGCGRLEWAVLDWNESAIAFYERLGARPMEGWSVYRLSGEELRAVAEA